MARKTIELLVRVSVPDHETIPAAAKDVREAINFWRQGWLRCEAVKKPNPAIARR